MTEAEALEILNNECEDPYKVQIALKVARLALKRRIAKPVKELNDRKDLYVASCTVCRYLVYRNQRYCDGCGQKLKWQDSEV